MVVRGGAVPLFGLLFGPLFGLCVGLCVGLPAGCIIPDRDIQAEDAIGNPGAVRIVEATNLPASFAATCNVMDNTQTCPQVPSGRRGGLVVERDEDGNVLPYCVCPEGSVDSRVVPEFFIYAEDPDREGPGPADDLFAVALLDLDPATSEPQIFVAYEQQLPPGSRGESFTLDELDPGALDPRDLNPDTDESVLFASQGREDNGLFRFRFGGNAGRGTDLCNDDNGTKLGAGMHTLTVMVTDRPFFTPPLVDANGNPVLGLDGRPRFGPTQWGMPDIAAGATWTIANYVFECIAEPPETESEDSVCACVPEEDLLP